MQHRELRAALKILGWSQAELGRRISTHRTTLSRWISEDRIPGAVAAYVTLSLEVRSLADNLAPGAKA